MSFVDNAVKQRVKIIFHDNILYNFSLIFAQFVHDNHKRAIQSTNGHICESESHRRKY